MRLISPLASARGRLATALLVALPLALSAATAPPAASPERGTPTPATTAAPTTAAPTVPSASPDAPAPTTTLPPVPAALTGPLDLRAGPVPVPLELTLPSLDVRAEVLGVGLTDADAMDAPMGPASDPVWHQAFWYRGSAVPGATSTALIAGHVNGPGGMAAVFARIEDLRPGDPIVVRDTRTGLDLTFVVDRAETYTLDQAAEPAVLRDIYGVGPATGTVPRDSADGLAHLNLITCAGTFRSGTHDHRLVVYATRA